MSPESSIYGTNRGKTFTPLFEPFQLRTFQRVVYSPVTLALRSTDLGSGLQNWSFEKTETPDGEITLSNPVHVGRFTRMDLSVYDLRVPGLRVEVGVTS